ncbi:hypothetical protein V8E53_015632 [Lactarius tabidus]
MVAYWPTPPGSSKDEDSANHQGSPICVQWPTPLFPSVSSVKALPPDLTLFTCMRDSATTLSDTNGGIDIDPLGRGTSCFQQELEAVGSGITKRGTTFDLVFARL